MRDLVAALSRRRRLIVVTAVTALLLSIVVSLLLSDRYMSKSSFFPEETNDASAAMRLAQQFGLSLPTSGSGESPHYYKDLLSSNDLLLDALRTELAVPGDSAKLITLLGFDDGDPASVRDAIQELKDRIIVNIDNLSGRVELQTFAETPAVAVAINQTLLDLMIDFNIAHRQSIAAAERRFVEGRLETAQRELFDAEAELEQFMEQNRRYEQSPELRVQAGRLQRRVDLRQQVYASLANSYEQARIGEVRNTPVVTVVESPANSVEEVSLGLVSRAVLFVGLALVALVALLVFMELADRRRT